MCTGLWVQPVKLIVSVQCEWPACIWVRWRVKAEPVAGGWHDNHLACLQEVISGLMLSICASRSPREKLTGLFMWLNSCSACYTANGGVEGGSWAGEQLLGFRLNSRIRHVTIHIWQSRVSVKAHVFTGECIRDTYRTQRDIHWMHCSLTKQSRRKEKMMAAIILIK